MKLTEETLLKFGFTRNTHAGGLVCSYELQGGPVKFEIWLQSKVLYLSNGKRNAPEIRIPLPDDHYRLWLLYKGFTGDDLPVL